MSNAQYPAKSCYPNSQYTASIMLHWPRKQTGISNKVISLVAFPGNLPDDNTNQINFRHCFKVKVQECYNLGDERSYSPGHIGGHLYSFETARTISRIN